MSAGVLQAAWLERGALARLLWPVSLVYGSIVRLRQALYRRRWLPAERLPVPVVVIGNVVAGGAGKTPVVMAVVDHLAARGIRAGVVSRGYGRRTRDCREVHAGDAAQDVGDEPLLIVRLCAVPVFVGADRAQAARQLLAAHPDVQVLVSDDGLQHLRLSRDVEVCVFDDRGVGNGWLLPAGPLRERWPRAVDLVLRSPVARGVASGYLVQRRLAGHAVRADGTRRPLAAFAASACTAVAATARPQAFFDMLRGQGLVLEATQSLPDHYGFESYTGPPDKDKPLFCTEKDAVKLWHHRPDAWAVPLALDIDAGFWTAFDRRLSSADGSETA